ncbi:8-oxo-dGTPase [Marinobacter pelagius]|uniref:8-oxo-dGTP diphosphatase n=1 Tax=Marinobacter pelagius TaxID=379482 RepID=A0A366GYN4_9GAMM|nr:Nudix family hydrolase [Marinobacter pelagius]RBP33700.1 8-oxo-dGTPase [Marinobacter pelagius]
MAAMQSPVREIHVAVGVIVRDGRVLIARRPDHVHQGGLLEFPGGKVEPGETVQQALVREIAEETGLSLSESSLEPVIGIRHDYGDKRVFLDVWRTSEASGEPEGREGQPVDWLEPDQLRDKDFPVANRPVIRALRLPGALAITGAMTSADDGLAGLEGGLEQLEASGATCVVLRAPELSPEDYVRFASKAVALCAEQGLTPILHGSPQIFDAVPGAGGLHLPWREAQALVSRPVPESVWLGVSCHDGDQLAHAAALGADYATLGPVQPTRSHPGRPAMGWEQFEALVAQAVIPVYALGGVGPGEAIAARRLGGQGVAGIRFWWRSDR